MIRILSFVLLTLSIFSCQESKDESQKDVKNFDERPYIQILGIAQDAGYPQAACTKSCCAEVWRDPSQKKMVSCLGLVDPLSQSGWLFDATPDFKSQLRILEENCQANLAGVLLTHAHMGHYTGLMHLGREAMGAKQVPVYVMPRMKTYLEQNGPWSQLVSLENIKLLPLKADSILPLNIALKVRPILVPHRDEFSETVGFHIQSPEKSALFIPDIDKWSKWGQDIVEWIKQVDVAFLDGTFFQNGEIPGRDMSLIPHPFVEESMRLFASLPMSEKAKVHFIHFNHTNPLLKKGAPERKTLMEAGFKIAEEGQRIFL